MRGEHLGPKGDQETPKHSDSFRYVLDNAFAEQDLKGAATLYQVGDTVYHPDFEGLRLKIKSFISEGNTEYAELTKPDGEIIKKQFPLSDLVTETNFQKAKKEISVEDLSLQKKEAFENLRRHNFLIFNERVHKFECDIGTIVYYADLNQSYKVVKIHNNPNFHNDSYSDDWEIDIRPNNSKEGYPVKKVKLREIITQSELDKIKSISTTENVLARFKKKISGLF